MSDTLATLNRLQRLEDQHAELAARLDNDMLYLRTENDSLRCRIAALESPAAAQDPVCQCGFPYDPKCMRRDCPGPDVECANCGHLKRFHSGYPFTPGPSCRVELARGARCSCSEYVPTAEPALDPGFRIAIRESVVRMAALNITVQEVDDITDAVIHTMQTYGRDGAR